MKKINSIIIFILIVSLFTVSCAPIQPVEKTTYTTYKDKNLNFSLEYPSDWTKLKVEGDMIFKQEDHMAKIKVISRKKYTDLLDLVSDYKKTLKGTITKDQETTIDGKYSWEIISKQDTKIKKSIIIDFGYFMILTIDYSETSKEADISKLNKIIYTINIPKKEINETKKSEETEEEIKPRCGNGICSDDENCNNCPEDCSCKDGETCNVDGKCESVECKSDSDCDDNKECTEDICYFAGNPNAYCGSKIINKCIDNDGCCPNDCNEESDNDCTAECGNGICEPSESISTCSQDCSEFTSGTVNLEQYDDNREVFSFDEGAVEDRDNANGDMTLRYRNNNTLESATGDNVIKHFGECDDLDEIDYASSTGYDEKLEVEEDHCYYIKTAEDKYGKIRIINIDPEDDIRFEWVFRPDGNRDLEQ